METEECKVYYKTDCDPQFPPLAQEGRGAYSYMLSVYLLLRPSTLRQGSKGRIRAEPKFQSLPTFTSSVI